MANVQIPNLPVAIALNGTEQVEAVQGGVSVRLTTSQIAGLSFGPVGGSDGQFQYNSSGVLGGASNFSYDAVNNRVGLGTTSPDALLSVNGVSSFGAGAVATPSVSAFGDLNTGMWFPAADTVAWSTGGTERMRITSLGRIGIGTSAPVVQFVVSDPTGNAAAQILGGTTSGDDSTIRIDIANTDGTSSVYFGDTTNGVGRISYEHTGDYMRFYTLSLERLRIDTSGNLLVGTTTAGTSAAKVLALGNATAPTTGPADTLQIYSSDLSAGNTMLSIYTEGTPVNVNATAAATHRIAIRVNGTVYYLLANTSA